MNRKAFKYVFLAVCCLTGADVKAQIQLPSVFTDGMVLQQNSKVALWGWGEPADRLNIVTSWATRDTVRTVVDSRGCWKAELSTSAAGGPYAISIAGNKDSRQIDNVMLGEVWLCSGQSNMEWSADMGILNGDKEVANAACDNLHILHIPKQGADTPQNDCRAKWETSSPESMRRTSATAYFFGRYLTETLGVPVGIIVSAWGGTPAEVWTPADIVDNDTILNEAAGKLKAYPYWPIEPGVLYNQMIAPVAPYTIAGCIWYQGESNQETAPSYSRLMCRMVDAWRSEFKQDFPFLYVQIAPYKYESKANTPALLREQQQLMLKLVDKAYMINISDLVTNVNDIHPRNKRAIGERLGDMAMHRVYGRKVRQYDSPSLASATLAGHKILLEFDGDFDYLTTASGKVSGLVVAGADGKMHQAKAKVKGRQLYVSVKGLKAPYKVFYCFDDATPGSLRTESGLPVLPFRTGNIDAE